MKLKRMAIFGVAATVLVGWGIAGAAYAQNQVSSSEGPAVFFPEKTFEFAPVVEGASVEHDFVVFNKGKAPLLINNVKTG